MVPKEPDPLLDSRLGRQTTGTVLGMRIRRDSPDRRGSQSGPGTMELNAIHTPGPFRSLDGDEPAILSSPAALQPELTVCLLCPSSCESPYRRMTSWPHPQGSVQWGRQTRRGRGRHGQTQVQ